MWKPNYKMIMMRLMNKNKILKIAIRFNNKINSNQ